MQYLKSQHVRCAQVAKATLSDANVMLDNTSGADQMDGRSGDHGHSEDPVREHFKAAAAVSPRFLLLDFRYELLFPSSFSVLTSAGHSLCHAPAYLRVC